MAINTKVSNLNINKNIPVVKGINVTSKSGIISFNEISLIQNFEKSPFLKKNELIRPLPKPQILPQ